MKCCRCDAEATFDSPENFCDEHWARWWGGYDPLDPPDDGDGPSEEMYRDALESAKRRRLAGDDEAEPT